MSDQTKHYSLRYLAVASDHSSHPLPRPFRQLGLHFPAHWRMLGSPQWGSIWSGSGRNTEKLTGTRPLGKPLQLLDSLPLRLELCQKHSKAHSPPVRSAQDNGCESHCHWDRTRFTKGSHLSNVTAVLLILGSLCALLTELTTLDVQRKKIPVNIEQKYPSRWMAKCVNMQHKPAL